MKNKAALVTGGAKRLGRGMALALAKNGINVVVHYSQSENEVRQTVADIRALGVKSIAIRADLLNENETFNLIAKATDAIGEPLSILINNASIFEYDTLKSASLNSWTRHMDSNLRAPFVLIQEFSKQYERYHSDMIKKSKTGCVINMIDQRVRKLTPEFMSYTIAKSALWTLTQTAAQALAPFIRVNAIGPGPTMQGARQSKDHFDKQRQAILLQRGVDLDDIVAAMNYILDASSVTGQLICVDGGQHLGWKTPDIIGIEP